MKVAVCMISFLFSVITEMAAWIQMSKDPASKYNDLLMIGGALISFIGMMTCLFNWPHDWLLCLIGYGMIIAAAVRNGLRKQDVHVGHHVVRCVLCLLLVIGFWFV